MTVTAVARIQQSFLAVAPQVDRLTRRFYDGLFAARPDTRALFTGDMARQRQHLAAALALIIRNLRMLDTLELPLGELGAAHARAGVRPEHYPPVHDAMMAALAEVGADGWTPELNEDWNNLLHVIARHMLAGAARRARPPHAHPIRPQQEGR
jgi:hemoglobin-like flavoprotein